MTAHDWRELGTREIDVVRTERTELAGAALGDFSRGFTSRRHPTRERVVLECRQDELTRMMAVRASRSRRGVATLAHGAVRCILYGAARPDLPPDPQLSIDWWQLAAGLGRRAVFNRRGVAVVASGLIRARYLGPVDEAATTAALDACKAGMDRYRTWRKADDARRESERSIMRGITFRTHEQG